MSGLDLRVGWRCEQNCRFCDQSTLRASFSDSGALWTPLPALLEAVRDRPRTGVLWLAGGEVLLRPDLLVLVSGMKEAGFRRIGVQTGGRILGASGAAAALRRAGLTDVALALHGDEGIHDWLTRSPGAWKAARTAARAARTSGLNLRIHTVLTRSLLPGLSSFVEGLPAFGPSLVRLALVREEGAAITEARALVPRLGLLSEPLAAAIDRLQQLGIEPETRGVPLCVLGGRRWAAADDEAPMRIAHLPDERTDPSAAAPACSVCSAASRCPKVPASYLRRFGSGELVPEGAPPLTRESRRVPLPSPPLSDAEVRAVPDASPPELAAKAALIEAPRSPPPDRLGRSSAPGLAWVRAARGEDPVPPGWASPLGDTLWIEVGAPCSLACAGCGAPGRNSESTRTIRQRLVRLAGEGPGRLVFAGASPWDHPALPDMVREALRLGFLEVEVWGPLHPLGQLDRGTARKLEGLTALRWPLLDASLVGRPGYSEEHERAVSFVRAWLPSVALGAYHPGEERPPPGAPATTACTPWLPDVALG